MTPIDRAFHLGEFFTLGELSVTRTGLPNTPPPAAIVQLVRLTTLLLDPIRDYVGPLVVDSAYRSRAVNDKVGGSKESAHLDGRAADITSPKYSAEELLRYIALGKFPGLDSAIWETRVREHGVVHWVHVQVATWQGRPRGLLMRSPSTGIYQPWTASPPSS